MWRRRKTKPRTQAELLAQTLEEIKEIQARRAKILPRFYRRLLPEWLDRRVLLAVLGLFVVFIADGVRRENEEFVAKLTQVTGQVQLQKAGQTQTTPALPKAKLEDGDMLATGPDSQATLEFPDGTAVTVAPNSVFEVRLIEYSRGGRWRSRSFRLLGGQIFAKVSKYFGAGSDLRVYTPAAVAAVRGTQFALSYDDSSKTAGLICLDGQVTYAGWAGTPVLVNPGQQSVVSYGSQPSNPAAAEPSAVVPFSAAAMIPDKSAPFLKKVELTMTAWLDLPLSVLGIGRCSWGVGAAEYARRAAAMESLRLIHQHLEGATEYPSFVDPCTLRELGIPERYAKRLLSVFSGGSIERYMGFGQSFVLYARARDKKRTLYRLTPYGVEKGTEEDERFLGY
ncbi:MAG: FecR family protein [Armatimonadetes bacterium]|nr:FecR family protein [Armatimonadota bacterium]